MEDNQKDQASKEEEEEEEEQIWSWGAGTDGQLATGKLQDEHFPQLLHLPHSICTLSCGGAHVIALTSGGKVVTWGRGTSGQLGHGDMLSSLHPKPVNFLDDYVITHASAGWSHSGFVSDTGCLFTCGDGTFGQLGLGDYGSYASPVKVSYFANTLVEQIACGMRHSLVLLKDCSRKQVYSFGAGKRGQLGISKDKVKSVSLPHVTCGLEDIEVISITANGDHSAALSADGNLYIWGRGFPGTSDVNTPRCLTSSSRFTKFALGWNHALGLTEDGEVFIIGGDRHGALCDLDKISSSKLTADNMDTVLERVSSIEGVKVVDIAAGAEHSALLTGDGTIMAWGWGEHGQLGLGNTVDHTQPQPVSLGPKPLNRRVISRVYCGSGFTFAVRAILTAKPDRVL